MHPYMYIQNMKIQTHPWSQKWKFSQQHLSVRLINQKKRNHVSQVLGERRLKKPPQSTVCDVAFPKAEISIFEGYIHRRWLNYLHWFNNNKKNHADEVADQVAKSLPLFPALPNGISSPLPVLSLQTCFPWSPSLVRGSDLFGHASGRCLHIGACLCVASGVSSCVPLRVSASAHTSLSGLSRLSGQQQVPGRCSVLLWNEVVEDRVDGGTQIEKLQSNNVKVLREVHHPRIFCIYVNDSADVERQPANYKCQNHHHCKTTHRHHNEPKHLKTSKGPREPSEIINKLNKTFT